MSTDLNCRANSLTRRTLIRRLSICAAASRLGLADGLQSPTLRHVPLQVSDLARSSEFYRRVFGCQAQNRDDGTVLLSLEKGHIILRRGNPPGFVDHFAIGIDGFDQEAVIRELRSRGVDPENDAIAAGWHVKDPDKIRVQVSSNTSYLGKPAAFAGSSLDHLSIYTTDFRRSVEYYERVFGFSVMRRETNRCLSSPTPASTWGTQLAFGKNYVTLRGGLSPAGIVDHFAIGIDGFNQESLIRDLKSRGAQPIADDPIKGLHIKDPDGFAVQVIRNDNGGRA